MDRLAAMAVAFIDVQLTSGAQAFQLFDSWAGTLSRADYERYVLPHSQRVFRELGERHPQAPGHPLRHRLRPPARGDARAPARGSWASTGARRSPTARERLGADLVVQGNLDPALVLAGAEPALAGTRAVLADNAGHPGHIFNLGHGVHPTTDPGVLAAIVDLVHDTTTAMTVGVVLMAYGTPRRAGGDRALLHRHPPRPAADARAARRPHPPLRRDRWHLPARRADRAGRATSCRRPSTSGRRARSSSPSASSTPRRRSRTASPRWPPPASSASSASSSPRTTRRCRSASTSAGPGPRPTAPGCRSHGIESWATEPAYVDFLAARRRRRPRRPAAGRRSCSPPTRCRSGSSPPATRTPTSCAPRPRPWPAALGLERVGDRLAVGRPHARAVDRPRHPRRRRRRSPADGAPALLVCPCGFVADHLEVLYDLDIEATAARRGRRPAVRPDALDERRPGRARRARRPRRRARRMTRDRRSSAVASPGWPRRTP